MKTIIAIVFLAVKTLLAAIDKTLLQTIKSSFMSKLCLLMLFSALLFKAKGQAGSLDPGFGNKGIQTTAFLDTSNTLSEEGRVMLISTNGNIFVVARLAVNGSYTRIVKYLPEGRLDSSYGNGGYSTTANLTVTSAVMQGNKIIAAGSILNDGIPGGIGLARYNPDGTLDTSFGENGIVKTDFYSDQANAIVLQGDKIIVGGYDNSNQFFLARYTTNGSLDSSFGENGNVTTDFNSSNSFVNAIILQRDKIIAAGGALNAVTFNYDFALARYSADGRLDSSFGENGKVTTDFNNSDDQATSITLQGDKILVAGFGDITIDFALARYTADGSLDSSFGENGKVTTNFNNNPYNYAYSITLQGDKILLAGESLGDIAIARYTADGALDSTFGENGKGTIDFNNNEDHAYSIALQGDKIIVAGSTFYYVGGFPADFAVIRYTANGSLDSSFGENGLIAGHFPSTKVYFTSTAIQGNKIIAAGYTAVNYFINAFALARYRAEGILDPSFGVNGRVITNFDSSDQKANSVVLQGDKIIVGGYTGNPFNGYDFMLARYTTNGTVDSTFGVNGRVVTDFNNGYNQVSAIEMQGDKILVTGYAYNQDNSIIFELARYTADGRLDSTFGENGKVTTDFGGFYQHANLLALQGDKIIAAGYVDGAGGNDFALARYTADGVLDSTFGVNGIVTTDINNFSDDQATSIALEGDKIILAGHSVDLFQNYTFVLARYTADGMLDVSFGENGKLTTDFQSFYGSKNSIAVQGCKIIVGGNIGNSDFSFARYTDEGKLDSSFGENGKVTTDLVGTSALGEIAVHQNRLYAVGSLTFGPDESYGVVASYLLKARKPAISIADVTVSESKKLAVVTVRLSAPATRLVCVHFTTRDKTAMYPQDYIRVEDTLLFVPGGNTTSQISIPIVDDQKCEATEQFKVRLTNADNAAIEDSIGVVSITDDDNALITNIGADNALITKQSTSLRVNASPNPSPGAFTIQLLGTNLKQQVRIRVYDISGRLIEERMNISIGQSLRLGDQYKAGTYIIEAVQGTQRVHIKVIKSGK